MNFQERYAFSECIYDNPLASEEDIQGFRMEGKAKITFPNGRMRMENVLDPSLGQEANFVFWCPEEFPDCVAFTWDFYPLREPGLAMFFFAARGSGGKDLFHPSLALRDGQYQRYYSGDIDTLHASYFRRKAPTERAFQTCNLRKSRGFHLVCQGADPLPSVEDATPPYRITLIKYKEEVLFAIRDLLIYHYVDDGGKYGPVLTSGKVGFRQMAPLMAEYSGFKAYRVEKRTPGEKSD